MWLLHEWERKTACPVAPFLNLASGNDINMLFSRGLSFCGGYTGTIHLHFGLLWNVSGTYFHICAGTIFDAYLVLGFRGPLANCPNIGSFLLVWALHQGNDTQVILSASWYARDGPLVGLPTRTFNSLKTLRKFLHAQTLILWNKLQTSLAEGWLKDHEISKICRVPKSSDTAKKCCFAVTEIIGITKTVGYLWPIFCGQWQLMNIDVHFYQFCGTKSFCVQNQMDLWS